LSGTRPETLNGSLLGSLNAGSLGTLERQLASHMGPMAGYHLRRALRDARSTEEFNQLVSDLVPEESPHRSLVRDALEKVTARSLPPVEPEPAPIAQREPPEPPAPDVTTDAFLAAVTKALMQVMGPIAPRLVARAQSRATARPELVALCAAMIERPDERARFEALVGSVLRS
jgi:serine/threonine-protein kinase